MNQINKKRIIVSKDDTQLKKSQKHNVNLQKNSTLYFQVGLIICLLATYFLMDMQFLSTDFKYNPNKYDDNIAETFTMDNYKIYVEPVKKKTKTVVKPKVKPRVINNNITPVSNDYVIKQEVEIITPEQNTTDKNVTNTSPPNEPIVKNMHIDLVEQVPIFPGCEGLSSNKERKNCMSEKISRLVRRKFDTSVGNNSGLKGKQRFYVQFKIDQNGNVAEIKTTAKHKSLDTEAKRVIGKIPKMQPGKQQDKNVSVIYNLPINFQVIN